MKNSKYVKNSINDIQEYAKSHGYRIKFKADNVNFYFTIYKYRWFGLNNKFIKKYFGIWDGREYNFNVVCECVRNFITEESYYVA